MTRSSDVEQVCVCGTPFPAGSPFCRNCGLKRPGYDDAGGQGSKEALRAELHKEFPFQGYIENGAQRVMTIGQIRHVMDFIKGNCMRWCTPGSVAPVSDLIDWYQVNTWMIQPATQEKKCSFVELLTNRGQDPYVFVSHCWSEKIVNFMKCLNQYADTRALHEDSGIWVCTYSRRQSLLDTSSATVDPQKSDAAKALQLSDRLLLILDDRTAESGQPMVFTRIWCLFEVFAALSYNDDRRSQRPALFDIAVVRCNQAELLTDGIAAADRLSLPSGVPASPEAGRIEASQAKALRESSFPIEVLLGGLQLEVGKAVASAESDRTAILNVLAGRAASEKLSLEEHTGYTMANRRIRAAVAAAAWQQAMLKQKADEMQLAEIVGADPGLQSLDLSFVSSGIGDTEVSSIAHGLSSGLRFLSLDFAQTDISDSGVAALMSAVPGQLATLSLGLSFTRIGDVAAEALGTQMPRKLKRLELRLAGACISDTGVSKLSSAWSGEVEELSLCFAECAGLGDAGVTSITRAGFSSLKVLQLDLSSTKVGDASVEQVAKSLSVSLEELDLDFACTSVTDRALGILAAPVGKLGKLGKLRLSFKGCAAVTDTAVSSLTRAAFQAGLKSLSLDLGGTRISDAAIGELGSLPRSLQSLWLGLSGCSEISEDCLSKLAAGLPIDVTEVTFCLADCIHLSDFAIASIVLNLPEKLSAVKFGGLAQTSVIPENCAKLEGIDQIQEWRTDLQNTKEYFVHGRLPSDSNDVLRLDFQALSRKVGDREVASLSKLISPSLSELHLSLNGCASISDDAMAKIAGSLPQEKISHMVLSLAGCSKVSDAGVIKLAEGLPACLQSLTLNFTNCKAITDSAMLAIERKLPGTLSTFRLFLDGTSVSETTRKLMERLEKPQLASAQPDSEKRKPYKKEKQRKKDEEAQRAKAQQAEEDQRQRDAEESKRRVDELKSWMFMDAKKAEEERKRQEDEMRKQKEEEARRFDEEKRRRQAELETQERLKREAQLAEEAAKRKAEEERMAKARAEPLPIQPAEERSPPKSARKSSEGASKKLPKKSARPKSAQEPNKNWMSLKHKPDQADVELHSGDGTEPFLGAYVDVAYCGTTVQGTVRFMGEVSFAPGEWIGVALEQPLSNHDGSMLGVRYFQSRPGCGLFVLPSAVQSVKPPGVFRMPKFVPLIQQGDAFASKQPPGTSSSVSPAATRSKSSPSLSRSGITPIGSSPARGSSKSPRFPKARNNGEPAPPWADSTWVKNSKANRPRESISKQGSLTSPFGPYGRR